MQSALAALRQGHPSTVAPPRSGPPLSGAARVAENAAYAGAMLFIVAMFTAPGDVYPWAAKVRPALVPAVLAAAALVARRIWGAPLELDGGRGGLLIGYSLVAFFSPLWSLSPQDSRTAAIEVMKLLGLYLALINCIRTHDRLRQAMYVAALAALVPALGALDNYVHDTDLVEGYRARWSASIYADPNHLAMFLVGVIPFSLVMISRAGKLLARSLAIGMVGIAIAGIVVTFSRGGALGLAAALFVYGISGKRHRLRSVALVLILLAAMMAFAPSQFWERQASTLSYESDASAMGRLHAWGVALNIGMVRPLGGVGGGAFTHAWDLYAPPGSGSYNYVAHNLFLEVLGEYGLFGLGFFTVFVFLAVRGVWRAARSGDPAIAPEARAVLAGVLGLLVCQMTSGFKLSTGLYLVLALAAVVDRLARAHPYAPPEPQAHARAAA